MSRFALVGNTVSPPPREAHSYFPNIIPEFEFRLSYARYDDSAFDQHVGIQTNSIILFLIFICLSAYFSIIRHVKEIVQL